MQDRRIQYCYQNNKYTFRALHGRLNQSLFHPLFSNSSRSFILSTPPFAHLSCTSFGTWHLPDGFFSHKRLNRLFLAASVGSLSDPSQPLSPSSDSPEASASEEPSEAVTGEGARLLGFEGVFIGVFTEARDESDPLVAASNFFCIAASWDMRSLLTCKHIPYS